MPQEFLASFGVDIDESGVNDLQRILIENRDLAASLSAAFQAASASIDDFIAKATESLPSLPFLKNGLFTPGMTGSDDAGFVFSLDFSKATRDLTAFMKSAQKQLRLTADASGVIAAANSALSSIQSSFASTKLKLNVDFSLPNSGGDQNTGNGQATVIDLRNLTNITPAATGGRFSEPTNLEVAEDGDPEYVIPVRKESLAIPLLQRLFADLSDSARDSLRQSLIGGNSITKTETGSGSSVAAGSFSFAAQDGASEETVHSDMSAQTQMDLTEESAHLSIPGQIAPHFSEQNTASLLSALSSLWKTQDEDDHDSVADISTSSPPGNDSIQLDSVSRHTNNRSSEDSFPVDFLSSLFSMLQQAAKTTKPDKESATDVSVSPDLNALTTSLSSLADLLSRDDASTLSLDQIADVLSSLPSQLSAASTAAPVNVSQVSHNSVDAPISIQVTASSASPEEVGRSVYDVAERYLMRTLEAVF